MRRHEKPCPTGHWSIRSIHYSYDTGKISPDNWVWYVWVGDHCNFGGKPIWEEICFTRENGMRATIDINKGGLTGIKITKLVNPEIKEKLNNTPWTMTGKPKWVTNDEVYDVYRIELNVEGFRLDVYFQAKQGAEPQRFLKTDGTAWSNGIGEWNCEGLKDYKYDYERKKYTKEQVFTCQIDQETAVKANLIYSGKLEVRKKGRKLDLVSYDLELHQIGKRTYSLYGFISGAGIEDILEELKKQAIRHLKD